MTEKLRLASRVLFLLLAGSLAAWVLYSAGVGTAALIRVHTVLLSAVATGFAWALAVILFYNWIVWAFSKPDRPHAQEKTQCD